MISKKFFKEINYKNCTILLEDYEADYILELLTNKKSINKKSISESLLNFIVNCDKRYFKPSNINEISNNILEAIGRSYDSDTITGNLSKQKQLADRGIFFDNGIYLEDDVINFDIDGKKSMRKISNEDEANIVAHNLIKMTINKSN